MAIDQLPPEMLTRILSCLHVNDMLRCRLVCCEWRLTIENNLRLRDLTVREHEEDREQFFVFTTQLMESSHQFVTSNLNFLQSQTIRNILKHLKRLSINRLDSALLFDLESLANLEYLEVREINLIAPRTLRSTSLKTLAVLRNCGKRLRLETPNLCMFEFEMGLDRFEFVFPESVSHLAATSFRKEFCQFQNLKFFYIGCPQIRGFFSTEIPSGILKLFPALCQLHCGLINKMVLSQILSDKNDLSRWNFEFFLCGLPINTTSELNGYVDPTNGLLFDFDLDSNFHFILEHYLDLTSPLPFIRSVNYSSLNRHFNRQIKREFFCKFINIRRLVVSEPIDDQPQFAWFVRKCKWLEELELKNVSLNSQSVYDWLPTGLAHLNRLTIEAGQPLDLSFVLSFEELTFFLTTQEVSLLFVANLINQLDRLLYLKFKHNDQTIEIRLITPLIRTSVSFKHFGSKNALVKFLESDASTKWFPQNCNSLNCQ